MTFKLDLEKKIIRDKSLLDIFSKDEISISFDKLNNEKSVDSEVLYINQNKFESELLFVFGYDFFISGLEEQKFKKDITQNPLNFRIYRAYLEIKKTKKQVKISDILNKLENNSKDSLEIDRILKKLLTLAYYMGWEIKNDKNSIESDFIIDIPNTWLFRVKQRFNFDIVSAIYEDENIFMFFNSKNKLITIFKQLNKFQKSDIEINVFKVLKKIFEIKKIN